MYYNVIPLLWSKRQSIVNVIGETVVIRSVTAALQKGKAKGAGSFCLRREKDYGSGTHLPICLVRLHDRMTEFLMPTEERLDHPICGKALLEAPQ